MRKTVINTILSSKDQSSRTRTNMKKTIGKFLILKTYQKVKAQETRKEQTEVRTY